MKPKCDNQKHLQLSKVSFDLDRLFIATTLLSCHPTQLNTTLKSCATLLTQLSLSVAVVFDYRHTHTHTFPHTQQRAQGQRFIRVSVAIVLVVDRACLSIIIDTYHLQFTCALWLCRCFFCPRCVVVQLKKVTLNNANAAATPTCRTHTHTRVCGRTPCKHLH